MRAPNHIAGGIVFTGIFASFWSVNIFAKVDYLIFSIFASLLPDIDHTRSLIGKAFFPLARWIDRHFGHRTITHSFLFLVIGTLACAFIEHLLSPNYHYTLILFMGVFSHFIFDMVTIQGIPLFYPFYRNPCVIFGNPSFRISTGNYRTELVAFSLFILLGVSCINLFRYGFWTAYNREFGTLKHINNENKNTDRQLKVEYNFMRNGKEYSGVAYVVHTNETNASFFDDTLFYLDHYDESIKIKMLKPFRTDKPKIKYEMSFFNITYDSLQHILKNKIITGNIQSSYPVDIIENNMAKRSNLIKLENRYNPIITIRSDSIANDKMNQLILKKERLAQMHNQYKIKCGEITKLQTHLSVLVKTCNIEADLYLKNKCQEEIIKTRRIIENKRDSIYLDDAVLLKEIELLEKESHIFDVRFSGLINYPIL